MDEWAMPPPAETRQRVGSDAHVQSFITTSPFYSCMCSLICDIRSYRAFYAFIFNVGMVIFDMQCVFVSLFMNCTDYWNQSPEISLIAKVVTAMVRFIPASSSYHSHYLVCIVMFGISLCQLVHIACTLYFYEPALVYTSANGKWKILISLNLARIMTVPSVAQLSYACLNFNGEYGLAMLAFTLVSCCVQLFGIYVLDLMETSFPSFRQSIFSRWCAKDVVFMNAMVVVVIAIQEGTASIDSDNWKLVCHIGFGVVYGIYAAKVYIAMPCVTRSGNCLELAITFTATLIAVMVAITIRLNVDPTTVLVVAIMMVAPCYVVGWIIAGARLKRMFLLSMDIHETGDVDALENISKSALIATACMSFPFYPGEWLLFEWLLKKYPDDFTLVHVFAKLVVLVPEADNVFARHLTSLLRDMNRLRGREASKCLMAGFFEVICIQRGDDVSTSINAGSKQVVDEYLMTLHLFWTEVLLGRVERLMSLGYAVDSKYRATLAFFDGLGNSSGGDEDRRRFRSVATLMLDAVRSKSTITVSEILLADGAEVFPTIEREVVTTPESCEKRGVRSLNVEQVAVDIKKRLMMAQAVVVYTPFVAAVIIAFLIIASVQIDGSILACWDYEEALINVAYPLGASLMLVPIMALQEDKIVDLDVFNYHLPNNDLFEHWLQRPATEMKSLVQKALDGLAPLILAQDEDLDLMLKEAVLIPPINVHPHPRISDYELPMTLFSFVNHYYLSINDNLKLNDSDGAGWARSVMLGNESHFMALHHQQLIQTLSANIYGFTETVKEKMMSQSEVYAENIEITYTSILIITFIVQMMAVYHIRRTFTRVFRVLFGLPKTAITQLVGNLGSRISADLGSKEATDSEVKYNLTQLSYQEAPQAFMVNKARIVRIVVMYTIIIVVIRILCVPMVLVTLSYDSMMMDNMVLSANELVLPLEYFLMAHDAFELLWLKKTNSTTSPEEYIEEIRKRLVDTTSYVYLVPSLSISDGSYYPSLHDPDVFLGQSECDGKSQIACRSLTGGMLFMIATIFNFVNEIDGGNDVISEWTPNCVVGSVLTAIAKHVPAVSDDLFSRVRETSSSYLTYDIYMVCGYLVVMMILYIFTRLFLVPKLTDPDFAISFLATIPPAVLSNFYADALGNNESTSADIGPYVFEKNNALDYVMHSIILLDPDNKVIAMTQSAKAKLQVEELGDFKEFFVSRGKDIELPPSKQFTVDLTIAMAGGNPTFALSLFPVKKFAFASGTVSYACVIEDISQIQELEAHLEMAINRVRILTTQLLPVQIANLILEDRSVQSMMVQKVLCASFMLRPSVRLTREDLMALQEVIRNLLGENKYLVYFGRTIQIFRVISGLFETQMAVTDQGIRTVSFAMALIRDIRACATNIDKAIDVHCGIHTVGPCWAEMVASEPPIYEVMGLGMTASDLVAAHGTANTVNITRDVYEIIFGQQFSITYETEIESITGNNLVIYMVQPSTK